MTRRLPISCETTSLDGAAPRSMRQRIVRDKQLVAEGHNIAMGKFYYQTLREIYDDRRPASEQLPVRRPEDPEDEELKLALIAFCKASSNIRLLVEWSE